MCIHVINRLIFVEVVSSDHRYKYSKEINVSLEMMCILYSFLLILSFGQQLVVFSKTRSSQTESIMDLYNQINEKGSLMDGLALNHRVQKKLKTINTIRLLPLEYLLINQSILVFNISLNKIQTNEEVKLIEFRLKLNDSSRRHHHRRLIIILRKEFLRKQRIRPLIISAEHSDYLSFDLTDDLFHNSSQQMLIIRRQSWLKNTLEQASLVIYSRTPGVFLQPSINPPRRKRSIKSRTITGPCSRHDLWIDFNQFSFGQWVVEPKRFNAGQCRGDCPNPLSRSLYPTNHAMLLSLLHERGNAIEQPSCVPVRLRSLDLLYYDRRDLVIKRHQGMQVEECGCR